MNSTFRLNEQTRALLALGRVSNLPTVWSNCLAAWMLAGAGWQPHFLLLWTGTTLLYLGGMLLNDAFDVEFDRKYRPERPIVSGQIGARDVWGLGLLCLALGWMALLPIGKGVPILGLTLVATIVWYNAVHKRTVLAPLIMASCRFLLYLVAAAAAGAITLAVGERALALAAYIVGLSYLARTESSGVHPRWPQPLLFVPMIVALCEGQLDDPMLWLSLVAFSAWVVWCLHSVSTRKARLLPGGVGGLLAGIPLVDWVAQGSGALGLWWIFLFLFLSALLLQRVVSAT
jgi:4-hydroxybenzoate polyprenyltransferase